MGCGENSGLTVTRRGGAKCGSQTPWRQLALRGMLGRWRELLLSEKERPTCGPGSGLHRGAEAGTQEPSGPSVMRAPWALLTVATQNWEVWENAVVRRRLFIALQKSKINALAQSRRCCGLLFCGFCWPTHPPQIAHRGQCSLSPATLLA